MPEHRRPDVMEYDPVIEAQAAERVDLSWHELLSENVSEIIDRAIRVEAAIIREQMRTRPVLPLVSEEVLIPAPDPLVARNPGGGSSLQQPPKKRPEPAGPIAKKPTKESTKTVSKKKPIRKLRIGIPGS